MKQLLLDGKPLDLAKLTPEQREAVDEYIELCERNPLVTYEPHPKQKAFHSSHRRTKAFLGGNRSGKTTAGIADDLIQAVDAKALPDHLLPYKKWEPPFYCRIVAPKFNENHEGVIFPKIRELVPRDQLAEGSWEKAFHKQRRMLFFANGSWFQFLTFEQDLDAFSGAALHRVHYDEEPPGDKGQQIHQENSARLIDHAGDVVFSMTPLFGLSWTYDLLWEGKGPETQKGVYDSEGLTVVSVDMDENPHIDQESKALYLASLPEKVREARKSGRFIHFAGLVYDEFDPELHLCPRPQRKDLKGQDVLVAIDPGIQTTAVVFASWDKDDVMLVFEELALHGEQAIPENAAKAIKSKLAEWDVSPDYFLIDPSARNRSLVNADNVQAAFTRHGIAPVPAQNELEAGIFEVKRRMDKRLILFSEHLMGLRNEFARYRREQRDDGKFGVVKGHDHEADCVRYLCMARPLPVSVDVSEPQEFHYRPGRAPSLEELEMATANSQSPPLGSMT